MFGFLARRPVLARDHAACSGCSVCLLVCPMWRSRRDPRFSPQGLAKALRCGATAADLAEPLEACSLCGACDPACPERIDLPDLIMDLRRQSPRSSALDELQAKMQQDAAADPDTAPRTTPDARTGAVLLPGPDLRANAALLARVQARLGLAVADDDGADIALALETGVEIPPARLQQFLAALRGRSMVVADGLLLRQLRRWLPGSTRVALGTALSSMAALRGKLGASDLYVIEPRAYHADYERMVKYYDRLQVETGCSLNLDLQRIAIPATAQGWSQKLGLSACDDAAQTQWILRGSRATRIVVESLADRTAFERVCDVPVVHVAELAQD